MSSRSKKRQEQMAALEVALREASGLSVLYSQAVAARVGISSTDIECLDYIVSHDNVTAGALAALTGLTTGAVTGVIDRLEAAGLACRQSDPHDRRKVLLVALPAAAERIMPLYAPMQRAAASAMAELDDEQIAALLRFFTRMREGALAAINELRSPPARQRATGKKIVSK